MKILDVSYSQPRIDYALAKAVYISTMDAKAYTPEDYPQGWKKYEPEEV